MSVHTCPLATLGGKKTGGMNVYVRDFSRALARLGVGVDVFTRSEDDCQPTVRHDLGFGARVIHIPAGPERPIRVPRIIDYLDEFVEGVLAFVRAENLKYDLIHSHYWMSGLVSERLKSIWDGAPVVQMFHTLGHMKNRIALNEEERATQARIDGENQVISFVDAIIAATPAEYAQLHWLYAADMAKVATIPPGVDLERFSPIPKKLAKSQVGIPDGHRNILFAGRIEPLKGVDTLLKAIALIQRQQPHAVQDVCVAIIGGDPWNDDPDDEMARLQELRSYLGVAETVTFLGAKDQDVLPDYYAATEMVVMPSHYESFGMVALEAMAMGRPVIASEVGGLAFLVKDGQNGFLVPSRDPEALAERIFTLLQDDACREALGEHAREHALAYDWPDITRRMLRVYASLLDGAERRSSAKV
ncbi:MAG: glycosyltransferase [Chloroflexota bacterium]|nr:MAG: glycosyltransferase [Chloroflexota bacterium]